MERLLENLRLEDEILLYGHFGEISLDALRFLNGNGYEQVYNMLGGLDVWINAGYAIVTE